MRGNAKLLVACVLAGALAVPVGAAAESAADSSQEMTYTDDKPRPDRGGERLALDCRAFSRDGEHAVGCHWSPSKAREFAGYRLVRGSRDERPATVFETAERRHTKALDDTVAGGQMYFYVVQAVDASGEVIAQSHPVRVHTGARPERPAPALSVPAVPSV